MTISVRVAGTRIASTRVASTPVEGFAHGAAGADLGMRAWLIGILGIALVVRLAVILAGPYIVHPDELFQYYEPAHRLAFGSGVVPWEFHDGARSWLIPGILAGIIKLSGWFAAEPITYIDTIRILCAVLSLSVVYVGFTLAHRRDGWLGAVLTGAICAVWIDPIYLAPSIMGEVLSAYCFLGAFLLTEPDGARAPPRRMMVAGLLLGLAVCLRVQVAPAMAVFAALRCRGEWRRCWLPLLAGGGLVVLLDLGLLDWLTWGAPFHSIAHYLERGLFEKFGGGYAEGAGSLHTYAQLLVAVWTPRALPLVFFLAIGAWRMPLLGAVTATVAGTHLFFANAEYRYLSCALLACPILIGAGAAYFCDVVRRVATHDRVAKLAAGAGVAAYVAFASWVAVNDGLLFRTLDRNILEAMLLAHRQPQLCGLGAIGVGWGAGWSYTYLDREVPIYGAGYTAAKPIGPAISIPQSVVLQGKWLPIYTDDEMVERTALYNFLIAPLDTRLGGYAPVACYDGDAVNSPLCLYRRPGGCDPPTVVPDVGG
jgi:phosphatidylinositol glycan class B